MADDHKDGKDYTDVGLRAGHPSRDVRSEEGIAHPQGQFVGDVGLKHEPSELGSFRPIVNTAVAVTLMTLASYALLYGLYHYWRWREVHRDIAKVPIAQETAPPQR